MACNIMVNRQACCSLFEPHSGSLYRTYEFDEPDEDGFVTIHSCMCEPENFKEQCGLPDEIEVPVQEDSYQDRDGSVQFRFVYIYYIPWSIYSDVLTYETATYETFGDKKNSQLMRLFLAI